MGLAAHTQVAGVNPKQVGQNTNSLLKQLYSTAAGQYGIQAQYEPQYTNLSNQDLGLDLMGNNMQPGVLNFYSGGTVPNVANTIGQINPGETGLLNNLEGTANQQLGLGTALNPQTTDQVLNSVNQNFSSRGMGGSPDNELQDAMALYNNGEAQLQTNENTAGNVASESGSLITQPSLSMGYNLLNTGIGQSSAASQGGSMYNTGDIESLMNTVYNANTATNAEDANNKAALTSAMIGGMSSLGGGMMGSM